MAGSDPALFILPAQAADGRLNLNGEAGTLRFYFAPDWSSGAPGGEARVLEFGVWTAKEQNSYAWLEVDDWGQSLRLVVTGPKGPVAILSAPIQWREGDWHQVALAWSEGQATVLYLDGLPAAAGSGFELKSLLSMPGVPGVCVGSDGQGSRLAQGQFDELYSFARACAAEELARNWQVQGNVMALGPITEEEEKARLEGIAQLNGMIPQLSLGASLMSGFSCLHALEQVSGSLATFGVRLLLRGEPLGQYRGVSLRRSPLTPRTARALRWLIGSRLVAADGVYFFESGRTWHSQTVTVELWDTTRTLTHLRSLSLPYREFYFDREVAPQTLVDLVKGSRAPDSIPGFIGSVNELENSTSLGYLKRPFFAANWLLIEPGERDDGSPGPVDYEALIRGKPPGSGSLGGSGYSRPLSPSPFFSPGGTGPGAGRPGSSWPSTTHYASAVSTHPTRLPDAAKP